MGKLHLVNTSQIFEQVFIALYLLNNERFSIEMVQIMSIVDVQFINIILCPSYINAILS